MRHGSSSDHDHCEFCWAKFMEEGYPEVWHEGYCTEDQYPGLRSVLFEFSAALCSETRIRMKLDANQPTAASPAMPSRFHVARASAGSLTGSLRPDYTLMISFIVPAHNEEVWVGHCISAIRGAMESVGEPFEIIVVDDSSADGTATVAEQHSARVIRVEHRQISATRNAGARQAGGDILFFVDADTLINAAVIQSALRSIHAGAVGGGCVPRFDGVVPLWWRLAYPVAVGIVRLLCLPGGACQFCTQRAFEATGGFSERHYAAEDALFVRSLKRQGRFVLLAEPVVTSGRNLRSHSWLSVVRLLIRFVIYGPDGFRDREGLELWYQPKREKAR